MKKTQLFMLIALLFTAMLLLASCGKEKEAAETQRPSNIRSELLAHSQMKYIVAFFPDESGKHLVPLSFRINETRDVVWVALEKLLSGTPNDFVQDALPEGFKLEDLYLQNSIVHIKLIGEKAEAAQINPAAFSATVNFALNDYSFDFRHLYPISILVNNEPITEAAYTLSEDQNFTIDDVNNMTRIFYSDKQAMYLIPVTVKLKNAPESDALYLAVLEKWIATPSVEHVTSTVPKGAKVLSASFKNGNLLVDLNKTAISYGGGHAQEYLFIESLLWTLSAYPEVISVQLTVEGETVPALPEGTSIKNPLPVPHQCQNLNVVEALH